MKPGVLGGWIGMVNAVVCAIGLGLGLETQSNADHEAGAFFYGVILLAIGACVPGGLIGVTLGTLADKLAHAPVVLRVSVLAVLALAAVVVLAALASSAAMISFMPFVAPACIPTFAAVLYLERRTRASASVPAAFAR